MALPIQATPKLGVAATKRFLKMVERDLKKPVRIVPPAEIAETVKFIREHENRQRQNY